VASIFVPGIVPPEEPGPDALCFAVSGRSLLLKEEARALPELGVLEFDVASAPMHYLGALDGRPSVVVVLEEGVAPRSGFELLPLRPLHAVIPDHLFQLAGRAVQIAEWHQNHRFCGRCGTPTEDVPGERAKRCLDCGLLAFPRLAPAVIVRVTRGDEILLAHGARFPEPIYSVLAGFVDPGESVEECVAREIREEVGIELEQIRYFGSQPWPFPHSLMLGFTARYAGGEIVIDESEIVDARWFSRGDLPRLLPGPISIARWLIDDWLRSA
jgi:NAD+ diphosphatase